MLNSAIHVRISKLVLFGVVIITLVIAPDTMLDPINLPKMAFLSTISFAIFLTLITGLKKSLVWGRYKQASFSAALFLLTLALTFVLNGPSWRQIFGDYGRNTGFLSYFCLLLLFMAAVHVSSKAFGYKLLASLLFVTLINVIYGAAQYVGLDPFDWQNSYNPIVGTLGNPNFVSALYGMGAIAGLALLMGTLAWKTRIFISLLIILSLFLAYRSDSIQGLIIFALGSSVIIYFRFIHENSNLIRISYLSTNLSAALIATLGILQIGPLAQFLYQDSVTYRGDYWRAGWKMTINNPITGVGLDQYGDFYRSARTVEATLRRGPEVTSNSAHNVLLDFSSFGGFPLLVSYLAIVGLGLVSAMKLVKKTKGYEPIIVGLLSVWLGYLAQSIISINQLGLAVWGWVLPGTIIGYQINSILVDDKPLDKVRSEVNHVLPARTSVATILGIAIGVMVTFRVIQNDSDFLRALQEQNGTELIRIAKSWPQTSFYVESTSRILLDNGLNEESRELSKLAIQENERNFRAWKLLYDNPNSSKTEKVLALRQMKALDPHNPLLDD